MSELSGSGGVQSVDRALSVLTILARAGEAGVSDIARELGVHKSTVFRLVATLEAHDMVEQHADRGKYRLGVGVLRLAGATSARLDVVQEARPIARELAAASGETVNLAILAETSALYVDQVAASSSLQAHNWVGQHIPLHATSNGKVLLSELAEEDWAQRLPRLTPYTARTVTSKARLRAQLVQTRERGYAVAIDELELGLTAVAAPVRDAHGEVIASLSVSGPTFRIEPARIEELLPMLLDAASTVSGRLGAIEALPRA
ncbi:MAG: IclR family transcriptional regulator [Ornithinimicrobium sp.]